MKLFISYPSDQKDLAERLRLALEAEHHSVFTDRSELKEGQPYHEALREAIESAEAMLFLITPRSIAPGSYALAELDIAQRRWRRPGGHLLPVMVTPTPIEDLPPYLRSVTLLQPRGDLVAETVAAVARLRRSLPRRSLLAAVALLLAAAGVWLAHQQAEHKRAEEQARLARQAAELSAAAQLCESGSYAVAWQQFDLIAAARPTDDAARTAREDCGMRWLREARVASGTQTFADLVAPILPVLARGLAGASGERRADLQAHLGWADFLRSRDGVSLPDPAVRYQAALADDPGNVYAHVMWAHWLVWRGGHIDDAVRRHFETAVKSTREHPWLRRMQFSAALLRAELNGYTLEVLNQMRLAGEQPDTSQRDLVWRQVIDWGLLADGPTREQLLSFVSPADALAVVEWLYPPEQMVADRQPLHRFALALLRARAGRQDEARSTLEALNHELVAAGQDSRLARATAQLLDQLSKPPATR